MLEINEYFYNFCGKDMFVHKSHTHDEVEIIQVVSGNGTLLKNNKTYLLQSQHVFVIDGRNAHIVYPKPEDCSTYVRNKIVIGADSLIDFCNSVGMTSILNDLFVSPPIPTARIPEIDELFKKVNLVCSAHSESNSLAHAYIIELLHTIHSNIKKSALADNKNTLSQILELIAERDGVITLSEISEKLHFNKHYICHMFREKTGVTLSTYISEKVYEKSIRLLTGTSLSVEKIASTCGFSSSASFSRFFKTKNGLSPMKFRLTESSSPVLNNKYPPV